MRSNDRSLGFQLQERSRNEEPNNKTRAELDCMEELKPQERTMLLKEAQLTLPNHFGGRARRQ